MATYLSAASVSCIPCRATIRRQLEAIIRRFGFQETAKLLAVPNWLLEGWRDGSGIIFAQQKRLIWLLWALHFAPWKVRSTFDIITSGRFVPDPVDGSLGWQKRMKSSKARRVDAYQQAGHRKRRKKRTKSK